MPALKVNEHSQGNMNRGDSMELRGVKKGIAVGDWEVKGFPLGA